jgi:DNA-binding NarL/FixJ family response regulator
MGAEALAQALVGRGVDARWCRGEIASLVRACEEHHPDVVVIPAINGRAPQGFRHMTVPSVIRAVSARVLVLLPQQNDRHRAVLLGEGAAACLTFDDGIDDLVETVRTAALGREGPVHARTAGPPTEHGLHPLDDRERLVLLLVAKGRTNREVAERIGVSIRSIENARSSIEGKLRIRGRSDFFEFALAHGLIV